ncbi:MAG TPA: RHS repeat-associated core domain-containing protein [Verrucomicrobiae bacterium]|nr:RHS repeat-associated core domain-containing protein [Verrucomicrobiae bacterium]
MTNRSFANDFRRAGASLVIDTLRIASTTNGWSRSRNLGYDAAGRIVTQSVNGVVHTNVYDKTDQLLGSSGSYAYTATYDPVGNRQTADGWTYSVNNLNQYTQRAQSGATNNVTYDDNGNVASFLGLSMSHDSQGQLVYEDRARVWLDYDYRRLRVEESQEFSDDDWEYTSFTYDARGNLLDRNVDYGETEYVYADGMDEAVLVRTGDGYGMDLYALVADHLGTVVAVVTDTGDALFSSDYRPFGDEPVSSAFGDGFSTLGFTGREYDENMGLYYYRNRWYSTELGRFLEPDPIGHGPVAIRTGALQKMLANYVGGPFDGQQAGKKIGMIAQVSTRVSGRGILGPVESPNVYNYVGNNPVGRTDPNGECFICGVLVIGGFIGFIAWFYVEVLSPPNEETQPNTPETPSSPTENMPPPTSPCPP